MCIWCLRLLYQVVVCFGFAFGGNSAPPALVCSYGSTDDCVVGWDEDSATPGEARCDGDNRAVGRVTRLSLPGIHLRQLVRSHWCGCDSYPESRVSAAPAGIHASVGLINPETDNSSCARPLPRSPPASARPGHRPRNASRSFRESEPLSAARTPSNPYLPSGSGEYRPRLHHSPLPSPPSPPPPLPAALTPRFSPP